jgi:hypothetical protein
MTELRTTLVGPWGLVSHEYSTPGGGLVRPFGLHPVGTLLYTDAGYMGAQLVQVDSVEPGGQAKEQSFSATWKPSDGGFTFEIRCASDASTIGSTNRRVTTIHEVDPPTLLIEWPDDNRSYRVLWRRLASREEVEP